MFFKPYIYHSLVLGWVVLLLHCPSALAEAVQFNHGSDRLAAHYLLPSKKGLKNSNKRPKAVIIFVHGDGPMNYDAEGYYPLIWHRLREQGYAIFSWDKPGVGKSTGDWLNQSMLDRQQEVRAAITFLQQRYGFNGKQIGLLGFSQAGWVVPAVAANNLNVGFVMGVGFAIDWIQQGWYHSKIRLQGEGKNAAQIAQARKQYMAEIEFLRAAPSYKGYLAWHNTRKANKNYSGDALTPERYQFILKNFRANSLADYQNIKQPFLLLLGSDDLNVDIQQTQQDLAPLLTAKNNRLQLSLLQNASHGLLKSKHFNAQSPGLVFWLKLMWMEEDAFSDAFFPLLLDWLETVETSD